MDLLPSEVLNCIFLFLSQEDKVECMLVCQYWKHIIEALCLFHTVRTSSPANLDALTKRMQHTPAQRAKLENLIVDINYEEEVHLYPLLSLLNNLRVFHSPNYKNHPPTIENACYPWQKTIEYVVEYSDNAIIRQLLRSSVCPNLTVLSTNDFDETLIPLLKNAPSLKQLTLGTGAIYLTYFEEIHQTLPFIESLTLNPTFLLDYVFDYEIKPAPLVCKLNIKIYESLDIQTKISILNYIRKKYTGLSMLRITNHDCYFIQEHDEQNINTHGWKPLLQAFSSHLKKLYTDHAFLPLNTLDLLNDSGSRLDLLSVDALLLKNLEKTSRIHYSIQYLELDAMNCSSLTWLKEFKNLRKLKLVNEYYEERPPIKLNDLLNSCPSTLKSLSLRCVDIVFDFTSEIIPVSIKMLSLQMMNLPDGTDTFLSMYFKQLSKLKLWRCEYEKKSFSLPNCHINRFKIVDYMEEESRGVLIKTLQNNEQRWYSIAYIESRYEPYNEYYGIPVQHQIAKSRSISKIKKNPFFTLTCYSVNNITITDAFNG